MKYIDDQLEPERRFLREQLAQLLRRHEAEKKLIIDRLIHLENISARAYLVPVESLPRDDALRGKSAVENSDLCGNDCGANPHG